MKDCFLAAIALALGATIGASMEVRAADAPPAWAYGFTTPALPGTPLAGPNPQQVLDNVTLHTLPGSKFSFTRAQIANRYGPADWYPEDHPAMPPLPNDPEQFRMIEECLELTFGRSGGKETTRMYEACLNRQLAAQR